MRPGLRIVADLAADRAGVVAQVWHGGQVGLAGLARLLARVDVVPVDDTLGKRA